MASTTKMEDSLEQKKSFDYKRVLKGVVICSFLMVAFVVLYYGSIDEFGQRLSSFYDFDYDSSLQPDNVVVDEKYYNLNEILKAAGTKEKTVIITTLNEAWAAPNSIFYVFLESFKVGIDTATLVDHLVVVAVDDAAYARCNATMSHCYLLKSNRSSEMTHEAIFMSPIYLDMMWERLAFLQTVLNLGYNFVFTDTDIMWLRNPFQHFVSYKDFQTSCDYSRFRESDIRSSPNNGFLFVRSNKRTIKFYEYWVSSRKNYPGLNEQAVFNQIKTDMFVTRSIGLRLRFLKTDYFGGFCTTSRDMNKVCTMHANCCIGLDRKIADLKTTLEDWKTYLNSSQSSAQPSHWSVPKECHM